MAIQNFVGGGFKGKLGAVIGQGWKSQKVLRTYQKPANPRTKKQQANRGNFAQCVKMAQLAMQMNWKSKLFQSDETTQWSIRIGTARKTFDKSMHEMYCLPLLPYGTVAKYGIADGYNKITGGIQFTVNTEEDLSGRTVSVLLYAFDTQKAEYDYFVLQSTVGYANSANTIDVMLPEKVELAENSLAALVSNDDDVFSDEIYMPTRPLAKTKEVVYFTLSNPTVSWVSGDDDIQIDFTPSMAIPATESSAAAQLSAHGVLQGKWGDYDTDEIRLISSNRLSAFISGALDSLNQRVQFPTGSSVTVGAFAFSDDDYIYTHEEETISFSETVQTQRLAYDNLVLNMGVDDWRGELGETDADDVQGTSYNVAFEGCNSSGGCYSRVSALSLRAISGKVVLHWNYPNICYWGANRQYTTTQDLTITLDGVVYSLPSGSVVTIVPLATFVTQLFLRTDGAMFWDWGGGDYFIVDTSAAYAIGESGFNTLKPTTVAKVIGGTVYNAVTPQVSDSEDYRTVYTFLNTGTTELPSPLTVRIVWSADAEVNQSINNTDGFVVKWAVKAGSYDVTLLETA